MNLQDIITYRENPVKEDYQQENENEQQKLSTSKSKNIEDIENNNINDDENKKENNNSSNYSHTGSNMIEKELENNKEHNIDNENNIDIGIHSNNLDNTNENNNINYNENNKENNIQVENTNIKEKDIIDELIEKIRNKQDLGINKSIQRQSLSQLDEDIKLGLEKINQIQTKNNNKSILDTQKELEVKKFEKNKKYNEVIKELSRIPERIKNKESGYNYGTYFDYKNMKILKPTMYFKSKNKYIQSYEPMKKRENKFYLSSIDGNAIINGERKNIDVNLDNLSSRIRNSINKKIEVNEIIDKRRSYSTKNSNEKNRKFPDFGLRKLNYYNKNYFLEELNRINKLLFS